MREMESSKEKTAQLFLKLLETMETLRGPQGCPWDKAQAPSDLNPHLLEEAYEVIEAVDAGEPDRLQEELGDLLLQIVFHAQMGRESGRFDMEAVLKSILEKLIRRHPHVFGDVKVKGVQEVLHNWEKIKAEEKKQKGESSLLSGIPATLPSLLKAYRLGEKASRVGFDWSNAADVVEKIKEEVQEFESEILKKDRERMKEELGDLLFALCNLSRFMKINPEEALRHACDKFMRRFQYVEQQLLLEKKSWSETNPKELDEFWNKAKEKESP
jgi:MazG family protein